MAKGLKDKLNTLIEQEGYLTLQQVYQVTESMGHKQRTAERVLNPSLSPNVITIKNDKGHIVAYKWNKNMGVLTHQDEAKTSVTHLDRNTSESFNSGGEFQQCCASSTLFKDKNEEPIHAQGCISLQKRVHEFKPQGLFA